VSHEIVVPRLAESISEAVLVEWLKADGAVVKRDEPVATLETDKAAVEIAADQAGTLHHVSRAGDTVRVGQSIARIDGAGPDAAPAPRTAAGRAPAPAPAGAQRAGAAAASPKPAAAPAASAAPPKPAVSAPPAPVPAAPPTPRAAAPAAPPAGPAVRRMLEEHELDASEIEATGPRSRLLKEDLQRHLESAPPTPAAAPASAAPLPPAAPEPGEEERVVPMSRIRLRIAERLVRAQHTAAILTTFNEIDMSAVLELRARHQEAFEKKHGVRLGFMSLFARATILALAELPELNAEIRGTDIVYRGRVHLGVAVGTPRGLVVPVVRGADALGFAGIEREIARLATRARDGSLTPEELSGGTFTISNGGVYGSLLSTPILNPPQSGILGMHKIEKRPIAVGETVVVHPMMYVALSYDHRIVDGEQAVTFLVRIKERLEDPERMLLGV